MNVIAGQGNITALPVDYESDGKGNLFAVMRWRGTVGAIQAFLPFVNTIGVRVSMRHDEPPFATLEARPGDAADGTPTDDASHVTRNTFWSLDGNDLEKSLWEHPNLKDWLDTYLPASAVPDQTYQTIVKELQEVVSGERLVNNLAWFGSIPAEPGRILGLMMRGVESYTLSQFVLKRTVTVPGFYTGSYANQNTNKQFTKAQLQSMEALPATLFFEMPSTGTWLKRTPSMRQLEDGRWEITNEWWHADAWATVLYPAVT